MKKKAKDKKPYRPRNPAENRIWQYPTKAEDNPRRGRLETFWVVRDATHPESTLVDICWETTPESFARYVIRTGLEQYRAENHTFYLDRASAEADAKARLAKGRKR